MSLLCGLAPPDPVQKWLGDGFCFVKINIWSGQGTRRFNKAASQLYPGLLDPSAAEDPCWLWAAFPPWTLCAAPSSVPGPGISRVLSWPLWDISDSAGRNVSLVLHETGLLRSLHSSDTRASTVLRFHLSFSLEQLLFYLHLWTCCFFCHLELGLNFRHSRRIQGIFRLLSNGLLLYVL